MPPINKQSVLKQAILQSVESGTFPESDEVASANVPAELLPDVLTGIQTARDAVRNDIKSVSKSVAPDVDGWISQATQLQADIEDSKNTAQQVVKQAEEAHKLRERRLDLSKKTDLLRSEVDYFSKLESVLQDVRDLALALNSAQDAARQGNVENALKHVQHVQSALSTFESLRNTAPVEILQQRTDRVKSGLIEKVQAQWATAMSCDIKNQTVNIRDKVTVEGSELRLGALVDLIRALGLFEKNIDAFCHDFDKAIITPLLYPGAGISGPLLKTGHRSLSLTGSRKRTANDVLEGIENAAKALNEWAPFVTPHVSATIASSITSRLQTHWLGPSVSTEVEHLESYQALLSSVAKFAESLSSLGWDNTSELSEWASSAPKVWLAKRREASLGRIRTLLSKGIHKRKTVERVETQKVHSDDFASNDDTADDWNENWEQDDEAAAKSPTKSQGKQNDEDGEADASAWGWDDDAESSPVAKKKETNGNAPDEEDDAAAWGWDDQGGQSEPSSPIKSRKQSRANGSGEPNRSQSREVTLRESYTTTAIPDELLEMIAQIVKDADTLRQPAHADSPIAPAVVGLFSIPTLALAGYRALAPTSYQSIVGGNMFRYNDSVRLAEELQRFAEQQARRDEASGQPRSGWPSTRMKLDAEITALEAFSRRAYGQEMDSQRQILRDLLDGTQGFANCAEQPFATECENAISATADRIRDVSAEWSSILSRSALLQSLGSLFSTVIHKMIVDIEDMSDIAEAESKQLRRFCQEMSKLNVLFTQDNGVGETTDMTPVYTPNWFKLQYLSEIMESSMADIKWLWHESDLKLEFEVEEIVDLIEALFAESDLRRRTIAEIKRG